MRLLIKFKPNENFFYYNITHYDIQGFIYSLLKENNVFKDYHELKGFKFFNFSNIFPVSDFNENEYKNLIISSPNPEFIRVLYNQIDNIKKYRLNKYYDGNY